VAAGGMVEIVTLGIALSISQLWLTGSPTLPAGSVARTENVCEPFEKLAYVFGLTHGTNVGESRAHSDWTPDSLAMNENVAAVADVVLGDCTICVTGGWVSTTHVWALTGPWLPARSVACTYSVYVPSPRLGEVYEPEHNRMSVSLRPQL